MIRANEAVRIAEDRTGLDAIKCTEYSDSYVISFSSEDSIGGFTSPIVVMKDDGFPMQMFEYAEISNRNPNEVGVDRDIMGLY